MFKVVVLAKRKPGMTMAEFKDYYETRHAVTGASLFPHVRRYVRNYLTPIENELAASGESPFDVVTEAFFDSEADYRKAMAAAEARPEAMAAQAADEENLFDRPTIWWFIADQCETNFDS